MNRISSLFVASALVILPVGAFAQQTVAPVKAAPPTGVTTTAPSSPATVKAAPATTADVSKPAKPEVKTPGAKTEVHGMNTVKTHHAKAHVPTKIAEPTKS